MLCKATGAVWHAIHVMRTISVPPARRLALVLLVAFRAVVTALATLVCSDLDDALAPSAILDLAANFSAKEELRIHATATEPVSLATSMAAACAAATQPPVSGEVQLAVAVSVTIQMQRMSGLLAR